MVVSGGSMKKYSKSLGSKIFDFINAVMCLLIALICLYPFIYIISVSISDYTAVGEGKVFLLPIKPHFELYVELIKASSVGRAYLNTILYTGVYTFLNLFLCSLGGHVLAEEKFELKALVTVFLAVTMFLGAGLIPTYLWITQLGMYDTIWAIVLPNAISAWNVFLFRTYIKENIHQSLKDSVYMDGGSDFTIYSRIVLPLIKPMLATFALFAIVRMWNDYFHPLIYLSDPNKMPLTIILRKALIKAASGTTGTDTSAADIDLAYRIGFEKARQMALVMITITPILFSYPFLQKYFVKGIMIGSVKG
jgi:putative aldouronate transport system permease protein